MSKKILHSCPNCNNQFKPADYFGLTVICSHCNSHFKAQDKDKGFWEKHHKKVMSFVLVIGLANFSVLLYKNWDRLMKKESHISSYIKHYWDDLQEDNLISIIKDCKLKNDFQCQMLAYKKLTELEPNNKFYQKNYEAKYNKYKNPPKLKLPEDY